MVRRLTAALAGLVLLVAGVAAVTPERAEAKRKPLPTRVSVGIGDQKIDMFHDERFEELGIRRARLVVPWDVFHIDWQLGDVDRWLRAAKEADIRVFVSFTHSREKGRRRELPSPERYQREFKKFRKRYPWVKEFAIWNEANHCGEPTCRREALIAAYYRKFRQACKHCDLTPAALLDMPNMVDYVREVTKELGFEPKQWALHNYLDVNRKSTSRLRKLLREVEGDIWLTETGGIVERRNRRKETVDFEESVKHAGEVTRFLLDKVVHVSSRVRRVYLYHWNSRTDRDSWDSALIDHEGDERTAFRVVRNRLEERRERVERRRKERERERERRERD